MHKRRDEESLHFLLHGDNTVMNVIRITVKLAAEDNLYHAVLYRALRYPCVVFLESRDFLPSQTGPESISLSATSQFRHKARGNLAAQRTYVGIGIYYLTDM